MHDEVSVPNAVWLLATMQKELHLPPIRFLLLQFWAWLYFQTGSTRRSRNLCHRQLLTVARVELEAGLGRSGQGFVPILVLPTLVRQSRCLNCVYIGVLLPVHSNSPPKDCFAYHRRQVKRARQNLVLQRDAAKWEGIVGWSR